MLRVISLFTGAGGLDYGFEAAGFTTAVAVEFDQACARFLKNNRPSWPLIHEDIRAVTSDDILRTGGLNAGEPDVLIGGPPCQPFSKSGYWSAGDARRMDDPRADTLTQFLRVLRDTRPKAFLMENVQGMLFKDKDEGFQHLLEGVAEVNRQAGTSYEISVAVLNAAQFGVPQVRERVFLVASRDGHQFDFPALRYKDPYQTNELLPEGGQPYFTAWDALADLDVDEADPALQVRGKWGALLPSIPEGQNYLFHTARGDGKEIFGWRRRYWAFLLKLAKDRPSWTIQAQPGTSTGPFHWKNRRLSAREMARLQTFPESLHFDCTHRAAQRLLGNAVPSLLAEILAKEIRRQILDISASPQLELLPRRKGPPPTAEHVAPVARQYWHLVGKQDAHPGEGFGPRGRPRLATS